MDHKEILTNSHHKFRFLMEELADETGNDTKKNRLVMEFQNEIDIYSAASNTYFKERMKETNSEKPNLEALTGAYIKRALVDLDPVNQDKTPWKQQIIRLKEEVQKLLIRFDQKIETQPNTL